MSDISNAFFTGRLGGDAELKFTSNNEPLLKFSVASDTGYKDSKSTTWRNCTIFGKRGESLAQYLVKGTRVAVTGEEKLREYTVDSGKRQSLDVRVSDIILLGSKKDAAQADDGGSEIPF